MDPISPSRYARDFTLLEAGVPDWVGYVQTAVTMAIDVGLAVGGATTGLEQGLGALIAVEVDMGSELIDRVKK
jgi:hypothetical protein